ncbi:hypothetical protein GF420_15840 [candidate division GN15 bacterium]|nr:hypothetical protein [candidate division GN15 bacterium]
MTRPNTLRLLALAILPLCAVPVEAAPSPRTVESFPLEGEREARRQALADMPLELGDLLLVKGEGRPFQVQVVTFREDGEPQTEHFYRVTAPDEGRAAALALEAAREDLDPFGDGEGPPPEVWGIHPLDF